MKSIIVRFWLIAPAVVCGAAHPAFAISVPNSGTCPTITSKTCLSITNTNPTVGVGTETILGYANQGDGLHGMATTGAGVMGLAQGSGGLAVYGNAPGGTSVKGTTSTTSQDAFAGVYGYSPSTAQGFGVYAFSDSGAAVTGGGNAARTGVFGYSGNPPSSLGNAVGVLGQAVTANGHAIHGCCTGSDCLDTIDSGFAGSFNGDVLIIGASDAGGLTLTTGTGTKPNGGSWSAASDRRVKKDVRPFTLGMAELLRIRPIFFKYNGLGGTTNDGKEYVGVIAQELERVVPSMVTSRKAKLRPGDVADSEIKQVDGSDFTYIMINALKSERRQTDQEDARLDTLEAATPVMSSMFPRSWTGAALLLLPVGLVVGLGKRRARSARPS
jgi:hypothetical protein